jgi:general secretion pathway protein G
MKAAFTLLELVFSIVVIGIIASFAIPKYMNTRDSALASTIKRDIVVTITSIQSHYLVYRNIEKISDAVTLNSSNWLIEDQKITFKDEDKDCVTLEVKDKLIKLSVLDDAGSVCDALINMDVKTQNFDLI